MMRSPFPLTVLLASFLCIELSMALAGPQTIYEYIIYPRNGLDHATNATQAVLQKVQGAAPMVPYVSLYDGVIYWLTNCTATQSLQLGTIFGVESVTLNQVDAIDFAAIPAPTPRAVDRKKRQQSISFSTQTSAPSDLRFVSQPSPTAGATQPGVDEFPNYVYESHAGSGVFVYHVEFGVNTVNPEFRRDKVEYLSTSRALNTIAQGPFATEISTSLNSIPGHSTCGASKITGASSGTAKQATLVAVQMAGYVESEIASIFDLVLRDIRSKLRQQKSVVSISWGKQLLDRTKPTPDWAAVQLQLKHLIENDVVVVCASGNGAVVTPNNPVARPYVDTAPAVFAPTLPIIVVGACDNTGAKADFSQGGLLTTTVLAPGVDVQCADLGMGLTTMSGTSFSAPMVAGVVAGFLARDDLPFVTGGGKTAANAKAYLLNHANWARVDKNRGIWNLVNEDENPLVMSA